MITINRIDCPDILKQGKNPKVKVNLNDRRFKFFSDQIIIHLLTEKLGLQRSDIKYIRTIV